MGRKYPEDSQSVYCPSSITHSPPGRANRKMRKKKKKKKKKKKNKKRRRGGGRTAQKKNTSQIYSDSQILRKGGGQVGV